jgi:ribosomal protein S18 acetylase RimI-like enzyme
VIELRTIDERTAAEISPLLARWACDAGSPLDEWRFGGKAQALAALQTWVLRPSSEVAFGRWQIAFRGETPEGGFVAMPGSDLAAARRADLLALVASGGDVGTLRDRLAAISDLFLPVEAGDVYLSRIAVETSARRRGLGARLLSAVIATAVQNGARAVRADVSADNEPAIALYRSAGFEIGSERISEQARLSYYAVRLPVSS